MTNRRSLTVAQFLPALEFGGVERGTLEVAQALVQQGHRSIVMSAGGRLVDQLVSEGSEHVAWLIDKKSPWTLRLVPKLRRWLADVKPDIIHARSRMPAWVVFLAWRSMPPSARPHFVTTVHGCYSVSPYSGVMLRGEKVIVVSEHVRQYALKNYKVPPERLTLVHRGVDAEDFPHDYQPSEAWQEAWYEQFPQLRDRFVVTLPGRLSRWKGQTDFIRVIGQLRAAGLPVEGVILGGGSQRRSGLAYVEELNDLAEREAPGHIHFVGHRDDVREVMAVSDIVLSLSKQPEAFGRIGLEALYLGVPVIGYAHGGVGEFLTELFPTGLVPLEDMNALREKITAFYNEMPSVPVPKAFSRREMLEKTISLYQSFA